MGILDFPVSPKYEEKEGGIPWSQASELSKCRNTGRRSETSSSPRWLGVMSKPSAPENVQLT